MYRFVNSVDNEPFIFDEKRRSNKSHELVTNQNNPVNTNVQVKQLKRPTKYGDFKSIDWPTDYMKFNLRQRYIDDLAKTSKVGKIMKFFDHSSVWIVIILLGVGLGIIAQTVATGLDILNSLREGYCSKTFLFSRKTCCWNSDKNRVISKFGSISCAEWITWGQHSGFNNSTKMHDFIGISVYCLFGMVLAFFSAVSVKHIAPYATGSGIAEGKTILGGFVVRGYLGIQTLFIKIVGLITAVSSGLTIGQEGPMVHIGMCFSNFLCRFFPAFKNNEAKKREILSAGAAGGVAVAFNAPIGGLLYSLEEISYFFPLKTLWQTFFCTVISVLMLKNLNAYPSRTSLLFFLDYNRSWKMIEIIPFIFVGVIGGVFGAIFTKFTKFWAHIRKTTFIGKHPIKEVLVIVLLSNILSYPNEYSRSSLHVLLDRMLANCEPDHNSGICDYDEKIVNGTLNYYNFGNQMKPAIGNLALTFITKSLLLFITFGLKVPSGVFVPAMALGSVAGRIIGLCVEYFTITYPETYIVKYTCGSTNDRCITPGLYGVLGAVAFLAGITRMTVALVVIMIELTGGLVYIIPIMVSTMIAKWIADAIQKIGIFEYAIINARLPYIDNKEELICISVASDVMIPKINESPLKCLHISMTIKEIVDTINDTTFTCFPIVTNSENYLFYGCIYRDELIKSLRSINSNTLSDNDRISFAKSDENNILNIGHAVEKNCITLFPRTPISAIVEIFRKLGVRQVFVLRNGYYNLLLPNKIKTN